MRRPVSHNEETRLTQCIPAMDPTFINAPPPPPYRRMHPAVLCTPNAPRRPISQVRALLEEAQRLRRSEYFSEGMPALSAEGPEGGKLPSSSLECIVSGGWSASEKLKLLQVSINDASFLSTVSQQIDTGYILL